MSFIYLGFFFIIYFKVDDDEFRSEIKSETNQEKNRLIQKKKPHRERKSLEITTVSRITQQTLNTQRPKIK